MKIEKTCFMEIYLLLFHLACRISALAQMRARLSQVQFMPASVSECTDQHTTITSNQSASFRSYQTHS